MFWRACFGLASALHGVIEAVDVDAVPAVAAGADVLVVVEVFVAADVDAVPAVAAGADVLVVVEVFVVADVDAVTTAGVGFGFCAGVVGVAVFPAAAVDAAGGVDPVVALVVLAAVVVVPGERRCRFPADWFVGVVDPPRPLLMVGAGRGFGLGGW